MINYKEFEVIKSMVCKNLYRADDIFLNTHHYVFEEIEEVQVLIDGLIEKGYVKNNKVTEEALVEIAPCKVKNAIILAAGGADISAKSVYSMPKGLFMKNGGNAYRTPNQAT